MKMLVKNTNINYEYYDNNSNISLVFLHGWGQNIEMMIPVAKPFLDSYNVLLIDLPGFGLSKEPSEVWTLDDYASAVNSMIKRLKIRNPILIGHSFGGKVCLVYALNYEVSKLVLLASPYNQKIKKPTTKMKVLKTIKKVPGLKIFENYVKKHVGSTDYKNASEVMRKILVAHVNTDLTDKLSNIKCPTLGIWGSNDEHVSVEDGKKLETLIENCGIVVYEGCTHYAYLENLNQTINILKNYIESE